jgi:hypothetical protein
MQQQRWQDKVEPAIQAVFEAEKLVNEPGGKVNLARSLLVLAQKQRECGNNGIVILNGVRLLYSNAVDEDPSVRAEAARELFDFAQKLHDSDALKALRFAIQIHINKVRADPHVKVDVWQDLHDVAQKLCISGTPEALGEAIDAYRETLQIVINAYSEAGEKDPTLKTAAEQGQRDVTQELRASGTPDALGAAIATYRETVANNPGLKAAAAQALLSVTQKLHAPGTPAALKLMIDAYRKAAKSNPELNAAACKVLDAAELYCSKDFSKPQSKESTYAFIMSLTDDPVVKLYVEQGMFEIELNKYARA